MKESEKYAFLAVDGIDAGKYEYNFRIDGKVCLDPYVREVAGREGIWKKERSSEA